MRHQKPLLMRLWFVTLKYVFNWIHDRWLQRCRGMIRIIGLIVCHLTPSSNPSCSSSGNSDKFIVFYGVSWIWFYLLMCVKSWHYIVNMQNKRYSKNGSKNNWSESTCTAAISLCLVEEGVVARRRRSAGVDGFEQKRLPFIRPESCYSRRHEWFGHRLIDRDSRARFAALLTTCCQPLVPA